MSTTAIGAECAARLKNRVCELDLVVKMLTEIETLIRFQAPELLYVFTRLSQSGKYRQFVFIDEGCRLLGEGKSIETAFEEAAERQPDALSLKKEDMGELQSFFASLGKSDVEGQIKICEMHKSLLAENRAAAVVQSEKKGRLYHMMGVFGGLALAVFLI